MNVMSVVTVLSLSVMFVIPYACIVHDVHDTSLLKVKFERKEHTNILGLVVTFLRKERSGGPRSGTSSLEPAAQI
jgi:hypothetical protein